MKKIALLFIVITIAFQLKAQKTEDISKAPKFEKYLTINSGFQYTKNNNSSVFSIGTPLPGILLENQKGNIHSFGFTDFRINSRKYSSINFYDVKSIDLGIGYEYKQVFAKNKKSKVKPFIGFGTDFYYSRIKEIGLDGNSFTYTNLSLSPYINPGFLIRHKKMYFELSIPIGIDVDIPTQPRPYTKVFLDAYRKTGVKFTFGVNF